MNIDKVIQILLEDCDGDKAENFSSLLVWGNYGIYTMNISWIK